MLKMKIKSIENQALSYEVGSFFAQNSQMFYGGEACWSRYEWWGA
jgi:hypothetical protein